MEFLQKCFETRHQSQKKKTFWSDNRKHTEKSTKPHNGINIHCCHRFCSTVGQPVQQIMSFRYEDQAGGFYLSKEGFSPQSNASCSSLTRLACPGSRKRPSSFSPRCRMKSTHCSTNIGASRFPYRFSYLTVSSSFWPKIPA